MRNVVASMSFNLARSDKGMLKCLYLGIVASEKVVKAMPATLNVSNDIHGGGIYPYSFAAREAVLFSAISRTLLASKGVPICTDRVCFGAVEMDRLDTDA